MLHPSCLFTKTPIDIKQGLSFQTAKEVANNLGIAPAKQDEVAQILLNLYDLFINKDASMVEINPFAEDSTGTFVCLDAKLKFDDNAEFRQKAVFDQRDWSQEDAREVEAANHNLNYIALDGDISCMVGRLPTSSTWVEEPRRPRLKRLSRLLPEIQ